MDYLAYVTAVAAFGGLVLGVLNTWKAHIEDKVKLRVTASLAKTDEEADLRACHRHEPEQFSCRSSFY